ncbi:MAG: ASCH domain-containing protein [Clostridiales bacterium]|nr:ASCH domain-containing protein [Clostridiales bacterium]
MTHHMCLSPLPFMLMQSGQKTIELRLFDEKRQRIQPGDWILFEHSDKPGLVLCTVVEALHIFPDFETLYQSLPLEECGHTKERIGEAQPSDMNAYYTKAQQKRYAVVGIQVRLLTSANIVK